jgi:hypothetical protein
MQYTPTTASWHAAAIRSAAVSAALGGMAQRQASKVAHTTIRRKLAMDDSSWVAMPPGPSRRPGREQQEYLEIPRPGSRPGPVQDAGVIAGHVLVKVPLSDLCYSLDCAGLRAVNAMLRITRGQARLLLVAALVTAAVGRAARAEEEAAPAAKSVGAAAPDEAADALAKRKQEEAKQKEAARRAADQQRQQQIAQQAQQMQPFCQPALQAELERVRKTCGSLPADARKKIAAAGSETVKLVARQWAERQLAGQMQGFDPRKTIDEAVAAALKPHATAEEFATYQREQAARVARRERAARIQIVTKLDSELELSQSQRQKIEADLEKHWQAGWLRELDDIGMVINNFRPAPDFADSCIAPHLDDRQKAEWKQWCQQAGWSRMGPHTGWNFNGQSMQPDPWWSQ